MWKAALIYDLQCKKRKKESSLDNLTAMEDHNNTIKIEGTSDMHF